MRLAGKLLRRVVYRVGEKGSGHCVTKAMHEVGEVVLSFRTRPRGIRDLLAAGFVVARTRHVRLSGGNWGKLVVKLLQDGLVGIFTMQQILWSQVPVVSVCKVARVNDYIIIVDGSCETSDGGVVQVWFNGRNVVLLCFGRIDGEAIRSIDA